MRQCPSLELVVSLVIKNVDVFLPHKLKNALNGRKGGNIQLLVCGPELTLHGLSVLISSRLVCASHDKLLLSDLVQVPA